MKSLKKMLLIWNDNETELIEDSDDFDRSQNVIPRKVFLKFKADAKVRLETSLDHEL